MTLNMNNGRGIFFQIRYIDTWTNLCKNLFFQKQSKTTMEPSKWGNILWNTNRTDNSINLKKVQQRVIEDLLYCALVFLFYLFL